MFSSLLSFKTLVIALITIGLLKLFLKIHKELTYWKNKQVPYVKPFPLFGSTWKLFFGFISFVDYFKWLYNYHPNAKYLCIMDFATPTIVLRDPELIKQVTVKDFERCPDHRGFVTEEMDPLFGKNVFSLTGDRWKEMRNILSPSFTTNKMKFIFTLVSKCSEDFVNYLYDHPEFSSSMEAKGVFSRYTNDVIATVAFGIDINSLKYRDNEFYMNGLEATSFSGLFRQLKFLMFRLSPRMMRMAGFRFLSNSTAAYFTQVITETVKAREERGIVRPDMIHLLTQARDEKKHQIAIDDIVAQAFIFFLAGFDTVSTAMSHMVFQLAMHQDIQEKLREEVDRYMDDENEEISYESLSRMKYLDMVISESLRINPPVIMTDRVCAKKFELPPAMDGCKSVTVNPNETVWCHVYWMHRDPKYFPDPEKFDPERFSDENKKNVQPYTYIPFGVGPRQCIGNRFALMEIKILIVRLLRKFVIKPDEKTKVPFVYRKGDFTTIPKGGLWVKLEKRES